MSEWKIQYPIPRLHRRTFAEGKRERIKDRMKLESAFAFGDTVTIDSGTVKGRVIGFCFYPHDSQVQVSWWNNGDVVEKWIAEWRLTAVKDS
jgi:hypothetical protein